MVLTEKAEAEQAVRGFLPEMGAGSGGSPKDAMP